MRPRKRIGPPRVAERSAKAAAPRKRAPRRSGASATGLFGALHESHRLQRELVDALLSEDIGISERASVFAKLKIELEAHAAAEERYVYVPILMSDAGLWSSRHALAEHHTIEELVDDLSVHEKKGPAWVKKARLLGEKVRHHLEEEEQKFFKVAGRILTDRQKAKLERDYRRELDRMRVRLA